MTEEKKNPQEQEALLWVDEKGKIIEPVFADYFLSLHPIKCFHDDLFTVDGIIDDEAGLKSEIYRLIRYYVTFSVARKIDMLLQVVKLSCVSAPPEIQTDRIHVANGTYFTDRRFLPDKEYCMNRLPVAYNPDAPKPERWLQFVNELLYEDDIPALQEYLGYCLLPVTKAQKMLLMVGKGGEGKSRVGLIFREIFGDSMNTGSLQKVETNRFTCFSNGSLQALYDKSDGFYHRQLLLTTKDKADGREDDLFLIDKKCVGTSRGFHNICLTTFVPINDDDPDLPLH